MNKLIILIISLIVTGIATYTIINNNKINNIIEANNQIYKECISDTICD